MRISAINKCAATIVLTCPSSIHVYSYVTIIYLPIPCTDNEHVQDHP